MDSVETEYFPGERIMEDLQPRRSHLGIGEEEVHGEAVVERTRRIDVDSAVASTFFILASCKYMRRDVAMRQDDVARRGTPCGGADFV